MHFISDFVFCVENLNQLDTVRRAIHGAIHSFRNGMLYSKAFTTEAPIRMFQCLDINLRTDFHSYWWKANTQSTSECLGRSLAMLMLFLHPSSHMTSDSAHHVLRGGSAGLDREGGYWKTLCIIIGLWVLAHKEENPVLARGDNFYDHITPKIWPSNSPGCSPFY